MDAGCPLHDNCQDVSGAKITCSGVSLGQTYSLCQPLGTPDNDATYTQAMAQAAAAAAPQPPAGALCALSPNAGQCSGVASCDGGNTNDAYFLDDSDLVNGYCYVWLFAPGIDNTNNTTVHAGHVYASTTGCGCPYSTDPTWN